MVQINKYVWYSSANFTWTGSWWSSSPSPSSLQWTAWPRRGKDSEWNGFTHQRWKHDASPVETLTSSAEGKPPRKESPPFWSRVMSDRSHQRKWNIKWCQIEEIEEGETPAKINAPMKVSRLNCWYVCLQSEQADVSTTRSVQELVKVVKVRFQDGSFPQFLAPIFYLSPLQVDWMNTTQLNGTRCVLFFFPDICRFTLMYLLFRLRTSKHMLSVAHTVLRSLKVTCQSAAWGKAADLILLWEFRVVFKILNAAVLRVRLGNWRRGWNWKGFKNRKQTWAV